MVACQKPLFLLCSPFWLLFLIPKPFSLPFSPYLQEKWWSIWIYLSGNSLKWLKIYMEGSKSAYAYSLPRVICIWPSCPHISTWTSALWSEEPVTMHLRGVWVMYVLGTGFVTIGRPRTTHETFWAQTKQSSVYSVFLVSTWERRDVGGPQASEVTCSSLLYGRAGPWKKVADVWPPFLHSLRHDHAPLWVKI